MPVKPIKITFTLDEADTGYFRVLYRDAKREASSQGPAHIVELVRGMLVRVKSQKKIPSYMAEAVQTLASLMEMLADEDWAMPKNEVAAVIAGLAYFANPKDLIHDDIPGLGFLDDAIMIKLLEEEFEHDIRGYRKFRVLVVSRDQRPWTHVAKERAPGKVAEFRKRVRADITKRKSSAVGKRRFLW
jgi:uncharacterized membrane protein YkvA (DUF1232 family)